MYVNCKQVYTQLYYYLSLLFNTPNLINGDDMLSVVIKIFLISHPNVVKATLGDVTARCATPAESMLSIVWAEWPSPNDKTVGQDCNTS